jgi:hypothetical protein
MLCSNRLSYISSTKTREYIDFWEFLKLLEHKIIKNAALLFSLRNPASLKKLASGLLSSGVRQEKAAAFSMPGSPS